MSHHKNQVSKTKKKNVTTQIGRTLFLFLDDDEDGFSTEEAKETKSLQKYARCASLLLQLLNIRSIYSLDLWKWEWNETKRKRRSFQQHFHSLNNALANEFVGFFVSSVMVGFRWWTVALNMAKLNLILHFCVPLLQQCVSNGWIFFGMFYMCVCSIDFLIHTLLLNPNTNSTTYSGQRKKADAEQSTKWCDHLALPRFRYLQ